MQESVASRAKLGLQAAYDMDVTPVRALSRFGIHVDTQSCAAWLNNRLTCPGRIAILPLGLCLLAKSPQQGCLEDQSGPFCLLQRKVLQVQDLIVGLNYCIAAGNFNRQSF